MVWSSIGTVLVESNCNIHIHYSENVTSSLSLSGIIEIVTALYHETKDKNQNRKDRQVRQGRMGAKELVVCTIMYRSETLTRFS